MDKSSAVRQIRGKIRRHTGRGSGSKTKKPIRAGLNAPYGFLKQQFHAVTDDQTIFSNNEHIEKDFYKSLQYFSSHYGCKTETYHSQPFPQNIWNAYRQAEDYLKFVEPAMFLKICSTEKTATVLVATDEVDPGMNLYYIPTEPLVLLHRKKDWPTFNLLLAIFAYLNQVAGVPTCTENDYMWNSYDMMHEWLIESMDEYEPDYFHKCMREIIYFKRNIKILDHAIGRKENLVGFDESLKIYAAVDNPHAPLLAIAGEIKSLYEQFPTATFYKNMVYEEDEYGERMFPEHYLSFYWSSYGWLSEQIDQMTNDYFQNYSSTEYPVKHIVFNKAKIHPSSGLKFERTLLKSIWELSAVLNDMLYD